MKKNDPLFLIDPRPYQAMLDQAKAQLEKDKALLKNADEDARRYAELVKKDYVTQEQYNQILTNFEALKSTIKADEAAVENANLQVGYCSIRAPLSGRTGTLLIHEGNQIKANDDKGMVVINQIRPIYVNFAVPEQNLAEIQKNMASRKLAVEATLQGREAPVTGELTFVDNAVDSTTGTIDLKAAFQNEDEALWDGQFVNVTLKLSTIRQATVVPSQAIQTSQAGSYVFVVKPDKTVEYRTVKTGIGYDGETVIVEGVSPGETVVTDGQLRLVPGAEVSILQGNQGK